jgi:[acyl-carrier-protein] S-malonyltransferase
MTWVTVVFPGQGSQALHMLTPFAQHPLLKEASDHLGYHVLTVQATEKIHDTCYTQPLLVICHYLHWLFWRERYPDVNVQCMAGHSVGEYAALLASGSITLAEALQITALRGRLMSGISGSMGAVIGLSATTLLQICQTINQNKQHFVALANDNSPTQQVVSGYDASVKACLAEARQQGAVLATMIPVTTPAHCALMAPIVSDFQAALNNITFKEPCYSILHNVTVSSVTRNDIAGVLLQQLTQGVRWTETTDKLTQMGHACVECGHGQILTKLMKRHQPALLWHER